MRRSQDDPPRPAVGARSGCILIIDDEEVVRKVAAAALEHLGFTQESARDGVDGLQTFAHDPARYRAVMLDLIMPVMRGDEVFDRLRRLRPDIPVLITSGFDQGTDLDGILAMPGTGFLGKPYLFKDLAVVLDQLLAVDDPG